MNALDGDVVNDLQAVRATGPVTVAGGNTRDRRGELKAVSDVIGMAVTRAISSTPTRKPSSRW